MQFISPGTGEPGGLPSMGSHRVGHDWSDLAAAAAVGNLLVLYIYIKAFILFIINIESISINVNVSKKGRMW